VNKKLLVCDLDNTLYDWVGYFVPAFYSLVDETIKVTGFDRETLLDDFRTVHQRHHDSEHPFALLETPSINKFYAGLSKKEIAQILDPAFHAFNSKRKEKLKLYHGVREALDILSSSGLILVAHTESKLFGVVDRLNRMGLSDYFRRIYCRERPKSEHPTGDDNWLSNFPMHKVVELLHHQRKPNPEVLLEICRDEGVSPSDTAYVGDSIAHDILMAQSAGVTSVWAKYGTYHNEEEYNKLVRVSHWTPEDVERERILKAQAENVQADFTLEESFIEIVQILSSDLPHSRMG